MTEIALVRRLTVNDPALPAFCALISTPDVHKEFPGFADPSPSGVNQIFRRLGTYAKTYRPSPSGFHGAFAADGSLLAVVGFLGKPHQSWMSFATAPNQRGQGLAAEAVRLVIRSLPKRPQSLNLFAFILPENHASCRVLHKLGFEDQGLRGAINGQPLQNFYRKITPDIADAPLADWAPKATAIAQSVPEMA